VIADELLEKGTELMKNSNMTSYHMFGLGLWMLFELPIFDLKRGLG